MSDVLVFWKDYRRNVAGRGPSTTKRTWNSSAAKFRRLSAGDRLWFVTSGAQLGREPRHAAFLVEVVRVQEVLENPGDEPDYPASAFRHRIVGELDADLLLEAPLLVDSIVRKPEWPSSQGIGRFLQSPQGIEGDRLERILEAARQSSR
jgi:hypothetical protein